MYKVDIIRKHIGNDDFYDMNGTPLLTKILAAMDEYAQQQVKNCNLHSVMVRFFEGWLIPGKCPECGKRKRRKGWKVCPDCMGGLDII